MSDVESEEERLPSEDAVLNKYKMAADVTNTVLEEIVKKCQPDADIMAICEYGDTRIKELSSKLFKTQKDIKKGIAFPTCISVNNIICHYAPIPTELAGPKTLANGDVVKIDLGAQVDGFAAVAGHSVVVGASPANPVEGRKADAILAAHTAAEAAIRMFKPGTKNMAITEMISKVTDEFQCKPIEGMQSHGMKQFVFDTDKCIVLNPTEEQRKKVETCEISLYDVWLLDILVSTGDGKAREHEQRTTVYKKNEFIYQLKMKASRQVFAEITNKFSAYPFNIRELDDMTKARFALTECSKHGLIQSMDVFAEKEGDFVAQFKTTVLIMPNGPMRLTGLNFENALYKSSFKVQNAEIKQLLSQPIKAKKKKAAAASTAAAKEGAAAKSNQTFLS